MASNTVKDIFQKNITINDGLGCTIEHNMNALIDNITITGAEYVASDGSKPFKKLFPVDSVLKAFRPNGAGIKYAIYGDVTSGTYHDPKGYDYALSYRTYYPGADTYYKYWISPEGQGADITITYPQAVLTNKIVVRFEISHSTPATWTLYKESNTQIASGTSSDIQAFGSGIYNAGTLTLYYNGSSWTTTEPTTIQAPTTINSLRLTTSGTSGKYVGVVEISPRWISDLSNRMAGFSVAKETSTGVDDLLPVGRVTSNSLSLELISYEDPFILKTYIKGQTFDSSKIYLYRQAELKPYYKVYYTGAPLSDSKGSYEKIPQGTFFLDQWSASEFGDFSLNALDGAKFLQETIAPNIFCENYSVTAIIRRLLDGIGFTNYKINLKKDNSGKIIDTSVFSPTYWWTDDSKPVWTAIQELCRDSQMVASFDDNNVLQFYTRDYLFDSTRSTDWTFRYSSSGDLLPNIVSMQKKDISTANQIKVLWATRFSNNVLPGNSQPLWQSETSYIGAFSLDETLLSSSGTGTYLKATPITADLNESQIAYRYNGYLVIDSEIIEFDAIEYGYTARDGSQKTITATSYNDIQKILSDIKQTSDPLEKLKQTGRIRIKTRGVFGTTVANHYASSSDILNSWNINDVTWEIA